MKRPAAVFAVAAAVACCAFAQSANQGFQTQDVQTMHRIKEMTPHLVKAREAVGKRDFARAKKDLEFILGKTSELSEAHFLMAKVLYAEKDYAASLAAMERAEKTFESFGMLMSGMREDRRADLLRRRAQVEVTINGLRARTPGSSTDANLQQTAALQAQIGRAEQMRTNIDRELNAIETGEVKEPAEYPFFHGNILLRLQRHSEAVAQYEEALAADPAYSDAANNLASLYYGARQYPKALEVLSRVEAKGATVNPELKKAIQDAMPKP